jgi:hypothetical protein
MASIAYKGNRIDIEDNNNLDIKINGGSIPVEANDDATLFSSPLVFGDAASPPDLARAVIDAQSSIDAPAIVLRGTTDVDIEPTLNIRRNLAGLLDEDRNKFRDAVFLLKERGEYDKYIKFHGFTTNLGHSGPAFFAWHRVFLRNFELELQQSDPKYADVTLPYWDYTSANVDSLNNSRIWRDDFFGTNGVVNLKWTGEDGSEKKWVLPGYKAHGPTIIERDGIRRNTFPLTSRFVPPVRFNEALRNTDYRSFEPVFEGQPHGGAHVVLGVGSGNDQGPPGGFATAVNDPFFMLLHCNVDRMWAKWQQLMKERWLANNPGMEYPTTQPAKDYYWDKSDAAHTAPDNVDARRAMPNRHNLEDEMWPWDATQSHSGRPDSKLVADADKKIYTPLSVLDRRKFGYDYDNLDPAGFEV